MEALDKIRIRLQKEYGDKSKEYKLLKNKKWEDTFANHTHLTPLIHRKFKNARTFIKRNLGGTTI